MKKTAVVKTLTLAIEREYYKQAQGKTINIMKINSLFTYCAERIAAGETTEEAVRMGIEQFCEPAQ